MTGWHDACSAEGNRQLPEDTLPPQQQGAPAPLHCKAPGCYTCGHGHQLFRQLGSQHSLWWHGSRSDSHNCREYREGGELHANYHCQVELLRHVFQCKTCDACVGTGQVVCMQLEARPDQCQNNCTASAKVKSAPIRLTSGRSMFKVDVLNNVL